MSGIYRQWKEKKKKKKEKKKGFKLKVSIELQFIPITDTVSVEGVGVKYNFATSSEYEFAPALERFSIESTRKFEINWGGKFQFDSRLEAIKKDDEDVIVAFLMAVGQ